MALPSIDPFLALLLLVTLFSLLFAVYVLISFFRPKPLGKPSAGMYYLFEIADVTSYAFRIKRPTIGTVTFGESELEAKSAYIPSNLSFRIPKKNIVGVGEFGRLGDKLVTLYYLKDDLLCYVTLTSPSADRFDQYSKNFTSVDFDTRMKFMFDSFPLENYLGKQDFGLIADKQPLIEERGWIVLVDIRYLKKGDLQQKLLSAPTEDEKRKVLGLLPLAYLTNASVLFLTDKMAFFDDAVRIDTRLGSSIVIPKEDILEVSRLKNGFHIKHKSSSAPERVTYHSNTADSLLAKLKEFGYPVKGI